MKGIPNAKVAAFARQDAKTALNHAAVVVYLTENGPVVVRNETPRLQVIAVIGPGFYSRLKLHLPEAVLLEIGIGTTYPYHETKNPKALWCENQWCAEKSKRFRVRARQRYARISSEQYLQVAPILFAEMQRIVNQRIASREKRNHLNPPYKPVTRIIHSRRKNTLFRWATKITAHPGSRFSVSVSDEHVLSDIYWLEQQADEVYRGRTKGLAHRIAKRLLPYAKNGIKWKPEKLKGFQDIDAMIENSALPAYKRAEVLRLIEEAPAGKKVYQYFRDELENRLNGNGGVPEEIRLIRQILPQPEERLAVLRHEEIERHIAEVKNWLGWDDSLMEKYCRRISSSPAWKKRYQILVTTGLDAQKDYIVFEITHSLPTSIAANEEDPAEEKLLTPALG